MRSIREQMRSRRSAELSVVQFRTLAFLDRRPGASLSELADHIGLMLPAVSKLVQGLVERRYLRRQTDARDRRRSALAPTAKGKRILTIARAATREHLVRFMKKLTREDCNALIRAMQPLRQIFLPDVATVQSSHPFNRRWAASRPKRQFKRRR